MRAIFKERVSLENIVNKLCYYSGFVTYVSSLNIFLRQSVKQLLFLHFSCKFRRCLIDGPKIILHSPKKSFVERNKT